MGPGDVGMEVELGDCMRYIDKKSNYLLVYISM